MLSGRLHVSTQSGRNAVFAIAKCKSKGPWRPTHTTIRLHRAGCVDALQCSQHERPINVNIEIMRAFVRLRAMLATHADLARRLNELEQKYDVKLRVVFEAIRELMTPGPVPRPGVSDSTPNIARMTTNKHRSPSFGSPGFAFSLRGIGSIHGLFDEHRTVAH